MAKEQYSSHYHQASTSNMFWCNMKITDSLYEKTYFRGDLTYLPYRISAYLVSFVLLVTG